MGLTPNVGDAVDRTIKDERRLKFQEIRRERRPSDGPFVITHTWVIVGDFDEDTTALPPMVVGLLGGEVDPALEERHVIGVNGGFLAGGGSITVSWKRGSTVIYSGEVLGAESAYNAWTDIDPFQIWDGDLIGPVITAHTTTDATDVFMAVKILVTPA